MRDPSRLEVGQNLTVFSVDSPDGSCIVVDEHGTKWELCVDECAAVGKEELNATINELLISADDAGCSDDLIVVSRSALERVGDLIR